MTKPLGQLSKMKNQRNQKREKPIGLQLRKSLLKKHMAQKY